MSWQVVLLRGVNVGGANKVPMARLRNLCLDAGFRGVQTYIASGNLVLESDLTPEETADKVAGIIRKEFGCDCQVLVHDAAGYRDRVAHCPFAPTEGKHVHAMFLFDEPDMDWGMCGSLRAATEELRLIGDVAWFHAPDGIGRSVLMQKIGKVIRGTEFTARNLNTLNKLSEMLDAAKA